MGNRRLSLIVAEDDFHMRDWLLTVLERAGAQVHEAATGWEVLSLLADHPDIDLVISDVRMPAPNGLQALAMARAAGIGVPFLIITGFGGEDVDLSATRMDARVLNKPFAAADLLHRIEELCGGGDGTTGGQPGPEAA